MSGMIPLALVGVKVGCVAGGGYYLYKVSKWGYDKLRGKK